MVIYKCPSCGGTMKFNAEKQQLMCEYCETAVGVDEADTLKTEKTEDFKLYQCPSCGAEILTDQYTAATFCSFCQSPTLVEGKLSGELAPSRLIAFRKNKEQAKEAYRAWTKKGLFTPGGFSRESTLDKITGMYVPFWLYDYRTRTQLDVEATRVRSERRGDTQYTHTDHYMVYRDVESDFLKVPADASEKMEDEVMDKLEPFNYGELAEFDMGYLSGFYAERYNFTSEQMRQRVERRVKNYAKESAVSTVKGYSTTVVRRENYSLKGVGAEYVMLPVWILNYRYKGKIFQFSMNGQTGKIVGSLPLSTGKMAGFFGAFTVLIFLILHIVFYFV